MPTFKEDKIADLSRIIENQRKFFSKSDDELFARKPSPEKWSKKEILGHMCDSCFNNLQRIIRVQYEDRPFIMYNQDEWVKIQDYQNRSAKDVIDIWVCLHLQFIHVLKTFPKNHLESIIDVGQEVTTRFVIMDYLDHQNHHLRQIFG